MCRARSTLRPSLLTSANGLLQPDGVRRGPSLARTGQVTHSRFFPSDRSTVFLGDANGEVVSVNVQGNFQITGMKVRLVWIVEIRNSSSC